MGGQAAGPRDASSAPDGAPGGGPDPPPHDLFGRDDQLRAIDELLATVASGRSGVLILRGDAGMGKSSLLDAGIRSAERHGMRIEQVRGVAGEAEFGFAALQRLLIPFMGGYDDLPTPQRTALSGAIGLADTEQADRFLVSLATLTLLADAEPDRPLVVVVDDSHWLDPESLDTLLFVARRLHAESVALLFAGRPSAPTGPTFDGLDVVDLEGLDPAPARALLSAAVEGPVATEVVERLVDATHGCPLALIEIVRELGPEHLSGGRALPDPLPISGTLEPLYLTRVRALPEESQQLLLLAAADSSARSATVLAAAAAAGLPADAADAAESAGLVRITDVVTFRHPLVRSAIYGGALASERRRAHSFLADALDPESDPDAWVWHRANAASGPDEEVAAALERRATESGRRGRYSANATLLTRSGELSPDADQRTRRLLDAATSHHVAGAPVVAVRLVEELLPTITDPLERARAERLHVSLVSLTRPADALPVLLDAARTMEPLDKELARITYLEGLFFAIMSSHLAQPGLPAELAARALATLTDDDTSAIPTVIRALAVRITSGHAAAADLMRAALRLVPREAELPSTVRWSSVVSLLASDLLDVDEFNAYMRSRMSTERAQGALGLLRSTISTAAFGETWCGHFEKAGAMWAEAADLSRSLGDKSPIWGLFGVELAAWNGDEELTRLAIDLLQSDAMTASRAGHTFNLAQSSLVLLELSLGRYEAALRAAWPIFERDPFSSGGKTLGDLVEAAHRAGDHEKAAAGLRRLEERATACGTGWAIGLCSRSTALLAGDDAEPHFVRALAELGATPVRTELARTHLLYGEWLRRQMRRRDARVQLETADDMFREMGATRFAERAEKELAAAGRRVRRRDGSVATELTPQEATIARLAAQQETNREIAAQLFLSAATVDYHLRKVYRKLGVDSRHKLRDVLQERAGV